METIQPTQEQDAPEKTSASKFSLTTIGLWAVVIGVLALVGWGLYNVNTARPEAGQPAPNFQMEYFNGYEWQSLSAASLEDMQGNVVILNFWASWCVECRVEADLLEQVWRRYKDDGVIMLGIAYADVEPNALAYMEEFNVTYPNAPDLRTAVSKNYEITGVPETFFIGKDGTIAHVQIGPINEATMVALVDRLLAEQ